MTEKELSYHAIDNVKACPKDRLTTSKKVCGQSLKCWSNLIAMKKSVIPCGSLVDLADQDVKCAYLLSLKS